MNGAEQPHDRRSILADVTWLQGRGMAALVVSTLVPADRQDAFATDLLDEAEIYHLPRHGAWRASWWLWCQLLASAPHLLVLRWRRRRGDDRAVGAREEDPAPVTSDEAGRGFALFMGNVACRGSLRRLPLLASVALHAVGILLAVLAPFWRVDELTPPNVMFKRIRIPPSPPPMVGVVLDGMGQNGGPGKVPSDGEKPRKDRKERDRKPITRVQPSAQPERADSTEPGDEGPTSSQSDVSGPSTDPGGGHLEGPPGGGGGGVGLPPTVGTKQCLSCPPPRLPPAYQRAGIAQRLLVRSCVDRDGGVTKVDVLRGISAEVDALVAAGVARWRFAPLLIDGRAVPFCYNTVFVFTTE